MAQSRGSIVLFWVPTLKEAVPPPPPPPPGEKAMLLGGLLVSLYSIRRFFTPPTNYITIRGLHNHKTGPQMYLILIKKNPYRIKVELFTLHANFTCNGLNCQRKTKATPGGI